MKNRIVKAEIKNKNKINLKKNKLFSENINRF